MTVLGRLFANQYLLIRWWCSSNISGCRHRLISDCRCREGWGWQWHWSLEWWAGGCTTLWSVDQLLATELLPSVHGARCIIYAIAVSWRTATAMFTDTASSYVSPIWPIMCLVGR